MENIRSIKLFLKITSSFLLGVFLVFPSISYAYEVSVHRELTYKTFKFYKDFFGDKFTSEVWGRGWLWVRQRW